MDSVQVNRIKFHAMIEREAHDLKWGSLSFNVMVVNGEPVLRTVKVVRQKRRKYIIDKAGR